MECLTVLEQTKDGAFLDDKEEELGVNFDICHGDATIHGVEQQQQRTCMSSVFPSLLSPLKRCPTHGTHTF